MLWNYSIIVTWIVFFAISANFWFSWNRFQALNSVVFGFFISSFPNVILTAMYVAAGRYVFIMATANIPLFNVPVMFYSYVLFNALLFWVPIITYAIVTDFNGLVSHMLPYGAPTGLMLFLPLVEVFSQIIRPLTLTIRFATNLSAGHIIMYMFSYFSLLSSVLAPFLSVVLVVLLLIEVFIAFLQSYIFLTLIGLYLAETI